MTLSAISADSGAHADSRFNLLLLMNILIMARCLLKTSQQKSTSTGNPYDKQADLPILWKKR
jgi:hypothetical protein